MAECPDLHRSTCSPVPRLGQDDIAAPDPRDPALADTAVLINEFGEVGLDHQLVERIDEKMVLMQSGCICCTIRGDCRGAPDLHSRRERGLIPPFRRGDREHRPRRSVSDPVDHAGRPGAAASFPPRQRRHHGRRGERRRSSSSRRNREAGGARRPARDHQGRPRRQTAVRRLEARLREHQSRPRHCRSAKAAHATRPPRRRTCSRRRNEAERRWLAVDHAAAHRDGGDRNRHDARIHAFTLTFAAEVDWTVFGMWLTLLLHSHGANVLRVKGILNVDGRNDAGGDERRAASRPSAPPPDRPAGR